MLGDYYTVATFLAYSCTPHPITSVNGPKVGVMRSYNFLRVDYGYHKLI